MKRKSALIAICFGSALVGLSCGSVMQTLTRSATAQETSTVSQLLKRQKQDKFCPDSFNLDSAQESSKAYKIDNQSYFVMVQCFLAAYQGNYEFLLYTPTARANPVKRLTVTEFIADQAGKPRKTESSSIGGLPTYDPKQQVLTVQTRYRGVGDCGTVARYRLQNAALNLLSFKAKFACDGKTTPYQQVFPPK